MIFYTLFALISIIAFRFLSWAYMRSTLKASKYRKAVDGSSFIHKWFFISLRKSIRNQYSKCEGRVISHSATAQILYLTNLWNHLFFVLYIVSDLIAIWLIHDASKSLLRTFSIVFYAVLLFELVALAIIVWAENSRYHKERMKHSKPFK